MFNYMTDLSTVNINPNETRTVTVQGMLILPTSLATPNESCFLLYVLLLAHDMESLLFKYMDEMLFKFCSDSFCVKKVEISLLDVDTFTVQATW